jgi:phosphomannomutase
MSSIALLLGHLSLKANSNQVLFAAGFDARHNSKAYAHLAAAVFASAGVKVRTCVLLQPYVQACMQQIQQAKKDEQLAQQLVLK